MPSGRTCHTATRTRFAVTLGCLVALAFSTTASAGLRPNTEAFPSSDVHFTSSAVTPTGELVVAGYANYDTPIVARFHADGSLDRGFGEDGYEFLDPTTGIGSATGVAIAVTPAGDIVILSTPERLEKLGSSGEIDRSFGVDGVAALPKPMGPGNSVDKLALDSAGRIVVAGTSGRGLAVARFTADGHPDLSFDGDGLATVSPVPASALQQNLSFQRGELVAVRPDDQLLVAGEAFTDSGDAEFVAAQFDTDGTLDTSFNGDGVSRIPAPAGGTEGSTRYFAARAIALDAAGSAVVRLAIQFVLPGLYGTCPGASALRLGDDGALDADFGDGGFARIDSSACPRDFALLDTAGLFAVGVQDDGRNLSLYVSQSRYTSDGQFDPGFAPQPRRSQVAGLRSEPTSVARLPSGVLVTSGSAAIPGCVTPQALQCSLGFLLAQQPDGDVVSGFGSQGVTTLPRTRICRDPFERCPYPYPREFARLARRAIGHTAYLVDDVLRAKLKCLSEVGEACRVRAWFTLPGSNRTLAELGERRISSGRTRRARSSHLSRGEIAAVQRLDHLDVHAVVSTAHQRPVRFAQSVIVTHE